MIGLDTNVLIRAFIVDEGEQTRKARQLIVRECSVEQPGQIASIVLAEAIWVLESVYGFGREAISAAVARLLSVDDIGFEHEPAIRTALASFSRHRADFADALVVEINRHAGCSATVTFDRNAARLDGFALLR